MSTDTKWIIGTVVGSAVAVVTTVLTVAGFLFAGINTRIDDVRGELRDFRMEVNTRMDGFDTRLRNVEIAFGKIDQRLLTIERIILPSQAPGE